MVHLVPDILLWGLDFVWIQQQNHRGMGFCKVSFCLHEVQNFFYLKKKILSDNWTLDKCKVQNSQMFFFELVPTEDPTVLAWEADLPLLVLVF